MMSNEKPNVLVIQPDQHRGTVMGCAGDSQVKTPNLDRLASEGIRFSRCASSSPVCSPFRGTMQTGLYCHTHGVDVNNILLNPELITFADLFADAGYATGYIGKWHLDGFKPRGWGGFIEPGPRRAGWREWHGYQKGHEFFEVWDYNENRERVRIKGYDWEPTWHTDMALDFAKRNRDAGRPWLYYLGYGPPHQPEQCPQKYLDMYDPDTFELPDDVKGRFGDRERELRWLYQVYYAQVTAVDVEIGRVMAGLEELGIADNTIVVYVSDHGDKLGSHCEPDDRNFRGKGSPFATAFRIPFIVRWPDHIKPNQVCDALVSSVDLTPTILDLAGLGIPDVMQGDSMASWCLEGKGVENDCVYMGLRGATQPDGWRAVWDGRYVFSPGIHNVLYDHESDPLEMENLIDAPQISGEKKRLAGLLVQMAEKTEDPMLQEVKGLCGV